MTKYDIVLFARQKEDFLSRLQDLGLVDITTTGWEPSEEQRDLMLSIERHKSAVARLKSIAGHEGFEPDEPYKTGDEAYAKYLEATRNLDELNAATAQAEKEASDLQAWGFFDPKRLKELDDSGVTLHFFTAGSKEFETRSPQWNEQYNVQKINEADGVTYFVVITGPDESVAIDAQEVKAPTVPAKEKEAEVRHLQEEKKPWDQQMARAAASVELITEHGEAEAERLHFSQASASAVDEAEGSLVVMEGWATRETSDKVDRMLEEYPNVFFIKSDPTPQDDTPTLLKNGKASSMFEIIGNFYSQPKYDTMDLTRYFGPFYALFFGLCLADAGYGLIYFVLGLVMRAKMPQMRQMANLVTLLGFSTVVCGTLMDSFFGVSITSWAPLAGLQDYLIGPNMFNISLMIGVVQILFAMCLKVWMYTRKYGLKYALSTIGWMITVIALLPVITDMFNIALPEAITKWSVVRLSMVGVGMFMMLFLNTPGKNPLLNFGKGLWNLYNDLVGFISDFLSYIRLFAIGLSGGILAQVFNMLAVGMSGDVVVLKQIVMIIILLIGHGLTLFMSTISAFVHPMRLTFVEFYKNAGFEDTQRIFTPLKRRQKNNTK